MYIKLLKCILVLCCCCLLNQESFGQRFRAGLVAGINLAQLDGDDLAGYNKFGFNVGGRVTTSLQDKWDISLELLFSQKGSKLSTKDGFSAYDRIHLSYAETPIVVTFSDWLEEEEEYYRININAGLSYARLLNFEVTQFDGADISDSRNYKRNNVNILIGATYFINKNIGANFRASWAIFNLEETQNFDPLKSKSLSFRVLYMF